MSKRKIAGTVADPTLPKTPIEIDGKTYNMCLNFGALAEAEYAMQREGHDVNLLLAFPNPCLHNTASLFAAAVRTFHPELSFEEAKALINLGNVFDIALALRNAWTSAIPTAEDKSLVPTVAAE